ncbi:uncharacterized protein PHACADRAFT_181804 [Phanerochaete carnosa HHB-10118-sp]|uniref:non-specific serine/threonine protein kinase n=1 Tax=Phanerochaete carnosa (strain HHB-10118-sp) TaxID=650164 RepID=K5VAI6_PHACS|nr:uncharacterized protein PHACADRAFT_181804 [Phanerochaete carnosa HHB-10118-sp]EKM59861.1 hypothetical protein PHACADRAFT_181804 [Phanerochaete carnosa HHB-10118-sp]
MSAIDSSPLPIPTFQASDQPCPKDLLDFLLNFIQLATSQSAEVLLHNSRKRWLSAFDTLNRSFLKPLELPDEFEWHMLHERTKLFEVTFELFCLLTTRCGEVLSYQEDLTKSMLCKLLDVASSLEIWLDVPDVPVKEGFPSPEKLYADCMKTMTAMLQALAGSAKIDHAGKPGWQILKSIGEECLAVCSDIMAAPPDATYYICLFMLPRIRMDRPSHPAVAESATRPKNVVRLKNYLDHAFICVRSSAQTPLMLTLLLELLLNALDTRNLDQTFMKSLTIHATEMAHQLHNFLVSPACLTSDAKRARAIGRLVTAISTSLRSLAPFNSIADPMRLHLLMRRLNDGPSDAWAKPDVLLIGAFSTPFTKPPVRVDVHSVLTLLKEEQWGDDGCNLRALASAYLQTTVSSLDDETVQEIAEYVDQKAGNASYADLAQALVQRKRGLAVQDVKAPDGTYDWRRHVKQIVYAIIQPAELDWMDDDDNTNGLQYITRALREVEKRFGVIYNPSASARLVLLQQLARLPCALTRHADAICHSTQTGLTVDSLRACMSVLGCAMDGTDREVTAAVRKAAYNALVRTLRHQPSTHTSAGLDHAADFALSGMKDADRNVRISAGRCAVELVNIYLRLENSSQERVDPLFGMINEVLGTGQDRWKETTLISLGHMARTSSPYVLGKVLFCIVAQLGHSNPLSAAAKHHKKATYNLLAPYLETIAPFVVGRLKTHPTTLLEVCNFVSSTPPAFLSVTLPYTLPGLFASRDRETLDILARELGTSIGQMLVEHGYKILPHVFLLSKPGQTSRAMTFMVSFFGKKLSGTPQTLISAHIIDTASQIILNMGDQDPATVFTAKQGLMKMQQYLDNNFYDTPEEAVRVCLDSQFLGVIHRFNDTLQASHTRYTSEDKCKTIRALSAIIEVVGHGVVVFAPQIMATMQTALTLPGLAETTLKTWDTFFRISKREDLSGYVRATSAAFVSAWPKFSLEAKELATKCLEYILSHADGGNAYKHDIVDLSSIPELHRIWQRVLESRAEMTPHARLMMLLDRITSDNAAVILLALQELKAFLLEDDERFIRGLTSGDMFDPVVGKILPALFSIAAKDHEGSDSMRLLALECVGICGAVDPDRFECDVQDGRMIVKTNFEDEEESVAFALHLIKDMLVGAFRSTYDINYQNILAYLIQELTKFCRFNRSLVNSGATGSLPIKVRNRWKELPRSVRDVVGPLLDGKWMFSNEPFDPVQPPIYATQSTYREWLQVWTRHLIYRVTGKQAQQIFSPFHPILQHLIKDVGVAHHIFPHLVLNVLLSGNEEHVRDIRAEILAVLENQVNPDSASTIEKRELCAQAIFMLMDHLNRWIHSMRQEATVKYRKKVNAGLSAEEMQVLQVESILTSIDRSLIAKAALRCKAYARALMCFEQQVLDMKDIDDQADTKVTAYETLHEIYAQLDEPDGMEGISTLILSPSLENQIREHESTGRWTSAQSCWEVRLQQSPNDLKSHLGLLRCLRNLGHYDINGAIQDTMRTHVEGLLVRNPTWQADLIDYQVESGCIIGDWPIVQSLVENTSQETSPILLARVLLAMRSGEEDAVQSALWTARRVLGAPIAAAGVRGYRHSYPAVLDLHMLHELQTIYDQGHACNAQRDSDESLDSLQHRLTERLDSTLSSFRYREPVLSTRRTVLGLQIGQSPRFKEVIGRSWLLTARLARKAGYKQTAYSALLQAQQLDAPFWFVQGAKLAKAMGDPLRALQEVENWLGRMKRAPIPMTQGQSAELSIVKAKVTTLRARWLAELDRHDRQIVLEIFKEGATLMESRESGWFYCGRFHDECAKSLPQKSKGDKQATWELTLHQRLVMNQQTVKDLLQACETGSKYINQALPRLLTLFLNVGDDDEAAYQSSQFKTMTKLMVKAIRTIPMYKWYTAFPQIVSRIGHPQGETYGFLKELIRQVIQQHPNQALWQFTSVLQSKQGDRRVRAEQILKKLKNPGAANGIAGLVEANIRLMTQLLKLCERSLPDHKKTFSMRQNFSFLANVVPSPCIIPLQESLIATMPTSPSADAEHQPFPVDAPTFHQFSDDVEIMPSLAKPRKITIMGTDGRQYNFLGKPKDDLRKDARIMDFNAIINKQLKANANTRRRQLCKPSFPTLDIRTYGVVTLNEECGFIQWVPNTVPVRTALTNAYNPHGMPIWGEKLKKSFDKLGAVRTDREAAEIFKREVLSEFPPVLHEWFLQMFPEPTAWLSSKLAYTRTSAVMCMVGFILGMGDRHTENLLLDTRTGDIVHVDFNCLFEKGKTLATPERVPFRLTQNFVDGFGVTGIEGVFRIACELAMQTLRDNKECLMIILDAFIHDPLVEWQDIKRQRDLQDRRGGQKMENAVKDNTDLEMLARNALGVISKKLQGIYSISHEKLSEREIPTSSLVEMLITEATDLRNLSKMYAGWSPHL